MKLPIKISPDHIKQSIVEVTYESSLPYEILLGYIFKSLDKSYNYTSYPVQTVDRLNNEIPVQFGVQDLFFTDKIKIQLYPRSILFNCLDTYLGWEEYRAEIIKALEQILTIEELNKFVRVGIRFISEYPEIDITNCSKFNFTFGIPEIKSNTFNFRSEFLWDGINVVLNLQHLVPKQTLTQNKNENIIVVKPTSTIDINVISEGLQIDNLNDLLKIIDLNHSKEKEVFFNILNSEYLATLSPVYN